MTGPLLAVNDPRFPPYFRLYWHEIAGLLRRHANLMNDVLKILCRDDQKWYTYCTDVFADPRAAFEKYATKKDKEVKRPRRTGNRSETKTAEEKENDLDLAKKMKELFAQEEEKRRERLAHQGYCNTMSTMIYEAMFNTECIRRIDEHLRTENLILWNRIHLNDCHQNDPAVQTFFSKFYREDDTLDQLAVAFQSLKDVESLKDKGFKNCFCDSGDMDERVRVFLRELPRASVFNEKLFFSEIIRKMIDGDHTAALNVLLPDYAEILNQKSAERKNINDAKRNLLEELVEEEDRLEMRPPPKREVDPDMEELVSQLVLREYQEELIENACRGKDQERNTIVVAPTGSGKTEVAVFIARYHLEEREAVNKPGRAVMLVPRIPLVEQQQARFRQYLRHRYYVGGFHGSLNMTIEERRRRFLEADIIVMTPEILWNMFRAVKKSERIYLADISLLIFDEVHHCRQKHAYNRIMQFIHDYKHPEILPQVVGLSASPLPTNVSDELTAKTEILKLLANANCYSLSTIVNNEESFEKYFAKPDEVYLRVQKPSLNDYEEAIKQVIGMMIKEILPDLDALVKGTSTAGFHLTPMESKLRYDGHPEKLNAQVENLKQKLKRLANSEMEKMKLFVVMDYLQALAKSLNINELLPCYFAFNYLQVEMADIQERYGNQYSDQFYNIFNKEYSKLEEISANSRQTFDYLEDKELRENKPIVSTLEEQLDKNFGENKDSRCIIFVNERATAKRLTRYLRERNIQMTGDRVGYITSSRDSDGMPPDKQRSVLAKFHDGRIQIIVATSILDEGIDVSACNLIIKYNLGSTARERIQRAGRARARGGKSIFICLSQSEAEKEFAAIVTIQLMKRCVKSMIDAGPAQTKFDIENMKMALAEDRAKKRTIEEENKRKLKDKQYNILCRTCERVLCDNSGMRKDDDSFYCVVNVDDENIWNNLGIGITIKKGKKFVDNDHQLVGSVFCLGQRNGQQTSIEELGDYSEMTSRPSNIFCGANLGHVYRIAGAYFPVLSVRELVFHQVDYLGEASTSLDAAKTWKRAAEEFFYIPELIGSDIRTMQNALINAKPNQAAWQDKLDAAVERIAATYEEDLARIKATENRRHNRGPRMDYVPRDQDDQEDSGLSDREEEDEM